MLNPKRLYNIALFYLKRYDSSSFNLRKVLKRRVLKEKFKNTEIPENINEVIEDIIKKIMDAGFVNDKKFLENIVRRLSNQGRSKSYIKKKLIFSGYKNEDFHEYLEENLDDEAETAKLFIKKHKLFLVKEKYEKEMGKMIRAGFSYSSIKDAISLIKEELD